MNRNNIAWVDTARGISIFLVVLGHTILPHSWLVYVFSFHIPLFFLLSGYLYNPEKYTSWWVFVKRKTTTILWPYLVFSALAYIYWLFFFKQQHYLDPLWQMLYSSDKLYPPAVPLWFLTCLFVVQILFYFLQKKLKPIPLFIAVALLTAVGFWLTKIHFELVWGVDIALIASLFYYGGFMLKTVRPYIKSVSLKWLGLTAITLLSIDFFLAHYNNYQFSMIYRAYNKEWIFVLTALCGSIGYLLLAKVLKETILKNIKVLDFLGQNSLIILGLHTIFYYFVSDFFHTILDLHPENNVLFAFIYTIITLLLITPFIYFINTKMPFLIGRKLPQISSK